MEYIVVIRADAPGFKPEIHKGRDLQSILRRVLQRQQVQHLDWDERIEREIIESYHAVPAKQIAESLRKKFRVRITKNMVIGRARKLGLCKVKALS